MNEPTATLLNEISQNAEMGKSAASQLLEIAEDPALRRHLQKQLAVYEQSSRRAHAMLAAEDERAKEQSPLAKMSAKVGLSVQTMRDNSTHNLADMLIQGSQMGATELTKAMHAYQDASESAMALAQQLQDTESRYVEELQSFL